MLEPAGLEPEDGELLIEREISGGGKSRAFVGSRPVAVSLLRELAPLLGDIHGQHDQQLLFSPDAQRDMLDTFASSGGVLARIADIYAGWKAAGTALETLERTEQEKLRLLDLWEFQRKEIESAAPIAGEDEAIEAERHVLQNLGRLQEYAGKNKPVYQWIECLPGGKFGARPTCCYQNTRKPHKRIPLRCNQLDQRSVEVAIRNVARSRRRVSGRTGRGLRIVRDEDGHERRARAIGPSLLHWRVRAD